MFSWKDFLKVAEDLSLSSQDEAKRRTAISRAYYAAFCAARKHLNDESITENIHRNVINAYQYSQNKDEKMIGWKLDLIRKHRVTADYFDSKPVTIDDVDYSIARAKEIFEIIEQAP
jgi:uncharacterized protein (UPF0332 family)